MRGIELRGKLKLDDSWACSDGFCTSTGEDKVKHYDIWSGSMWREVDPETVGQYIGLKDKNAVKIFEGDIVRYKGMALAVRWDVEKAGFFVGEDKYWMMNGMDIEVIGNIHDNPELLEVRNED